MKKKLTMCLLAAVFFVQGTQAQFLCNPLNIPYRYSLDGGYREAADPSLINFNGEYYLFASKCGAYFHSTDLVNWTPVESNLPIEGYAPTVEAMNGKLYFTHSVGTTKIYVTDNPKSGVWEEVKGGGTKSNQNDPMLCYVNDKMYLYWGSSGDPSQYLCGQELSTETLKPVGKVASLVGFNNDKLGWEVPGDYNENKDGNPWLEGTFVTPYNGKYYLQYSAPGTEAKSYCDAVYVSDEPLGKYTVQRHNPFCYRPEGFVASAGHGSTFQDNYGNWWHISTGTISKRHMFERRLVMYPVFFDKDGEMWAYTGFGDWPMKMPDHKITSPDELMSGWQLLSYKKSAKASSAATGQRGSYAVDENIRTWWSAKTGNEGEWLRVDLGNQCTINAVQVNFADCQSKIVGTTDDVYKYRVEVSDDDETWTVVSDKSDNTANAPHDFIVLDNAVKARYVRVYNVHTPSGFFSLSGLRVFGINSDVSAPAEAQLATVVRDSADRRDVTLTWDQVAGASGYNIRYGYAPDKLYLNYEVLGGATKKLTIRSLNVNEEYYFAIDSWNEGGTTRGTKVLSTVPDGDTGDSLAATFENPVIYADCPDPDICRVGDTFYMVSTTMHMSPGCTVMKSKDLVNWAVCGYAHDQLEETDNFALKNGQNVYADGSWAANIRYDKYEGLFYVILTCNSTGKSYMFTTKDVEKGMWKKYILPKCYDPGLLFDDTGTEIRKWVIYPSDDLNKYMGFKREIFTNQGDTVYLGAQKRIIDHANLENPAQGLRAEGYHGYKIGDYYYIFMIQGVGAQRQQIVWRSTSMDPNTFEGKLVFAGNIKDVDGNDYLPFTGVAQGGIVDTPDGHWYAMLFQDYGAVGRIPVLIPMTWSDDGWPVIGNGGTSVDRYNAMPVLGVSANENQPVGFGVTVSDEFDNQPTHYQISAEESDNEEYKYYGSNLKLNWQWNHNPDNRYWTLTEREGWLRLKTGSLSTSIRNARNTLTQRTFGPTSAAATCLDVSGLQDGDCAGLASYQNQYGFVGVVQEEGKRYIVMRRAEKKDDSEGKEMARLELAQDIVYLRVACDFTDKRDLATFYYSLDGETWQKIGDGLEMAFDWPDFVGQRFGLFCFATKQVGGHADFDWFRVSKNLDDTFSTTGIGAIFDSGATVADCGKVCADDRVFTIDGRCVGSSCGSLPRGLYVSNGKVVSW